jgi:tetratricopeptide (TPR) repeat protein
MRIISCILTLFLFLLAAPAAASEDPDGRAIARLDSPNEVQHVLDNLHARFNAVQESRQLSFALQKTIVEQSGACISRLVDISQSADLSRQPEMEAFKAAFLKNSDMLRGMLAYNQTRVDDMLEARLEQLQDKEAFFDSPEWQQPQYLLSVASYWLGWNNYYAALLYLESDTKRTKLLDEAVSGFTRTLPDLKEQSLANRCIFGRALCFKEKKKYDKALQDIQSLMAKVPRDDLLYMQAGYELALISHLSGMNERAVKQVQELQSEGTFVAMPQQIKDQLTHLKTRIALGIAEKKTSAPAGAHAKASYDEAVRELKHIAEADAAQAGVFYQYVFDHAQHLADRPEADLGSIGSLAIADWHFDRKEYEPAGEQYQRLFAAPDNFINQYLDGLYFRLAYCYAQKQQWQDALGCLETLFQKYPGSSFGGKAACLYHVVAAQVYQAQATDSAYARYIKAAECYVKNCPDAQDKSEAHFQLGRYYQQRGRMQDALIQFKTVGSDSPHYPDARHAVLLITVNQLQSDVEELELLIRDGQGQSEKAVKRYRESIKQAEDCHKTVTRLRTQNGDSELEAYLTILLARLYMRASEPSPRKSLQLLRDFEGTQAVQKQQEMLYDMARKLRLECYLQLGMLKDAEQEVAAIAGKTPVDKITWAFLNGCAERYYTLAKADQSKTAHEDSARNAAAAQVVYAKLVSVAGQEPAYWNQHAPIQMRLAEMYAIDHKLAQAAAIYQEMLAGDPTSADVLYNLAGIYERDGRWEDAFTAWNKLARGLNPGSSSWLEARFRMAQTLIHLGKHKEACEVIAVTRSRCPEQGNEEMERAYLKLQGEFCPHQDMSDAENE